MLPGAELGDGLYLLPPVERVDGHLLLFADAVEERNHRFLNKGHLPRLHDRSAHVQQQERISNRGHLRVEDGLLALIGRDELAVFVYLELIGRRPRYGLALGGVHREIQSDIAGFLNAGVYQMKA